jgi:hypothetical protein
MSWYTLYTISSLQGSEGELKWNVAEKSRGYEVTVWSDNPALQGAFVSITCEDADVSKYASFKYDSDTELYKGSAKIEMDQLQKLSDHSEKGPLNIKLYVDAACPIVESLRRATMSILKQIGEDLSVELLISQSD